MERLFNPRNPFLSAWVWIYDADGGSYSGSIGAPTERPSRPEATALYYAALCGFSGLVNYLMSTHAEDVNARCGLHNTPLHAASHEGHLDAARSLLDHRADVNVKNARDETPLCSAYARRHVGVMRLLLDHGANADIQYSTGFVLGAASRHGNVEVVHMLLQYSVDINRTAGCLYNWTALHHASDCGHPKVVKLLLEHGAEINALSEANNTPLRLASANGHLEVVQILLEHGADVHIRGEHNQTPFQRATSENHTEVAQLLLEHGAEKE